MEPTLDQLLVFQRVATVGSFTAAARELGRAQSAVSYAVATLEEALGLTLFSREGKRPVLTPAGRALLDDVRAVRGRVDRLVGRAVSLRGRVESEVSLAVDTMFPIESLVPALEETAALWPSIPFRIRVEALGAVGELVRDGTCQIGLGLGVDLAGEALDLTPLLGIELVPVVAAGHPLAAIPGPLPVDLLVDYVQIVLSSRHRPEQAPDRGVFSARVWRVSDLHVRHRLILAGLGWGNMPRRTIQADLESGRLVALPLATAVLRPPLIAMVVATRPSAPPGPAGRTLIERLVAQAARCDTP